MKPPLEILAALRDRDIYDLCEEVARQHGMKLCDVFAPSKAAEIVEARHAVFHKVYLFFGGNASAVARLIGTDPSTVRYAVESEPPLIQSVVLAKFETEHHAYTFRWQAGRINPFGITDRVADTTTWYPSYQLARDVYSRACEEAGAQTFRSHSKPAEVAR